MQGGTGFTVRQGSECFVGMSIFQWSVRSVVTPQNLPQSPRFTVCLRANCSTLCHHEKLYFSFDYSDLRDFKRGHGVLGVYLSLDLAFRVRHLSAGYFVLGLSFNTALQNADFSIRVPDPSF